MCISNFTQRELNEGEPVTERTEMAVLCDDEYLYIGFWGYDSQPERIIATEMKRDLFGALFAQWNSEFDEVLLNFRVNWIPIPGADLFFVVNQRIDTTNQEWKFNRISVLSKIMWRFALQFF